MTLLVRHPDTPPGAVHSIDVDLRRTPGGAIATFRVAGDLARLVIPAAAAPGRADGLWKTSCLELFVGGAGNAYREFNFSPSGQWAAYDFTDSRSPAGNAPAQVSVRSSSDSRQLTLIAEIECDIPNPAPVGMSAVIEEDDGLLRYWALTFAPGRPDFHAAATRALLLDGVDAQ